VLHLVVPTVGRPTAGAVVRRAIVAEPALARLTVVSQACPAVVDDSLRAAAVAAGVVLEERRLDSRVGAARARLVGASSSSGTGTEFVGFLDDDIAMEAGTLSDLVVLCSDLGLGGACGVVVNAAENTRPYRMLKGVFFRSIFRDPRSAAVGATGVVRSPVLSGGVTVFRRWVFDACAESMSDFPADYSWGEDFELSYRASLVSLLAIDPSVRVRNQHLGMSRAEVDRDDVARRRIERYRGFADRHTHRRRDWAAYLGVVVGLSGMAVRQRVGGGVRRLLLAEAAHAVRQTVFGAHRSPGASYAPRKNPDVAAVITYFQSGRTVVAAVESLVAQGVAPASVTVVANSPVPADIAAELAGLGADVVGAGANLGFAAACNLGAGGAAARGADFLWFVNPDVTCAKDCLETLLGHGGPALAVAPVLLLPDGGVERSAKSRSYLRPAVLLSRELGLGRTLRLGSPTPPRRARPVVAVSGACLLVPAAAFRRIGGFAEEFFLYGEDIDLCLRLRRSGCSVAVIPEAHAVHASGTGSGDPTTADVQAIKGREARRAHLLLLRRHRSEATAARYLAGLVWVLRARRLVRRGSVADRAAWEWLVEERRRAAPTGAR
jgi:GT2 family glycosyltransferase